MTTRTRTRAAAQAPAPAIDAEAERRLVEALIFVADEPVTLDQIGQVLEHRNADELRALVGDVQRELESGGHGLRLEQVAGGYRLSTCPDLAPWVRTFFRHRNRARLSPASIETLAVIAYKQPVTAPEIQEIRGVDPQGSVKTLLEKRLIRMAGKKRVVGRPFLYATTREFLVHFGLASIDDLPPIEDFEKLAGRIEAAAAADTEASTSDGVEADPVETVVGAEEGDDEGPEGERGVESDSPAHARAARGWTDSEEE